MTKNLVSVAVNKYYKRDPDATDGEEFVPIIELVLIGDEAGYVRSNGGQIVRERKLSSSKFWFMKEDWPKLRDLIEKLVEADEKDLN